MSLKLPRIFNLTRGRASPDFIEFYNALARRNGSLVGLDVGTRYVGIAVSDEGRRVAFKSFAYCRATLEEDRHVVHRQMEQTGAAGIIVGIPLVRNWDCSGDLSKFIATYSALLLKGIDCAGCAFWDESYTSIHANFKIQEATKKAARRDARLRKQMVDEVFGPPSLRSTQSTNYQYRGRPPKYYKKY